MRDFPLPGSEREWIVALLGIGMRSLTLALKLWPWHLMPCVFEGPWLGVGLEVQSRGLVGGSFCEVMHKGE